MLDLNKKAGTPYSQDRIYIQFPWEMEFEFLSEIKSHLLSCP